MRKIAEEAIAKINFDVELDRLVGTLSVAEKQMVAISRALMFNARLIIMDEPTTALTRKEVQALFKIIMHLKEQGIAILSSATSSTRSLRSPSASPSSAAANWSSPATPGIWTIANSPTT